MGRSPRRAGLGAAVAVLLALAGAGVHAASVPSDVGGLTAYAVEAFAQALPAARVSAKEPLVLSVVVGSEPPYQVQLHNLFDYCRRDPGNCDTAFQDFVAKVSASLGEAATPVERTQLRLVVRSTAYLDDVRKQLAGKPGSEPVVRPIAGDLWLMAVADRPHGVKSLAGADLAKLGLSEDQAIDLARRNLAQAMGPLSVVVHDLPRNGIGYVNGNFYDSSRLLFHEDWTSLSARMNGRLIVAVPATDFLIYGEARDRIAVGAIVGLVNDVARKAPRPISRTLLKWLPSGWEVVTP